MQPATCPSAVLSKDPMEKRGGAGGGGGGGGRHCEARLVRVGLWDERDPVRGMWSTYFCVNLLVESLCWCELMFM